MCSGPGQKVRWTAKVRLVPVAGAVCVGFDFLHRCSPDVGGKRFGPVVFRRCQRQRRQEIRRCGDAWRQRRPKIEEPVQRRQDGTVIERIRSLAARRRRRPDDAARLYERRDDQGRNSDAVAVELESVRIRAAGRDGRRRRHMIEAAAVLVVGDDKQGALPGRRGANRIVDAGDELLAIAKVMGRVLVVGDRLRRPAWIIARFDEAVVRQPAARRMALEFILVQAEAGQKSSATGRSGSRLAAGHGSRSSSCSRGNRGGGKWSVGIAASGRESASARC